MAHRVISQRRSISVAFGLKRTSSRPLDHAAAAASPISASIRTCTAAATSTIASSFYGRPRRQ